MPELLAIEARRFIGEFRERVGRMLVGVAAERAQGLQLADPSTCAAKPRVLTASVIGSAPVRIYVANAGPTPESGRIQVTQCQDAPDCAAGGACAQCSAERWGRDSCK